jgi:hypothetical protein
MFSQILLYKLTIDQQPVVVVFNDEKKEDTKNFFLLIHVFHYEKNSLIVKLFLLL